MQNLPVYGALVLELHIPLHPENPGGADDALLWHRSSRWRERGSSSLAKYDDVEVGRGQDESLRPRRPTVARRRLTFKRSENACEYAESAT